MTDRFICKKCKRTFIELPLKHGFLHFTNYPDKPREEEMCDGNVVEVSSDIEVNPGQEKKK